MSRGPRQLYRLCDLSWISQETAAAERLRYVKETEAGKVELVGLAEEFFNEGMAQGKAEGEAKANHKAAIGLLKEGADHSMIARVLGFTLEEVQEMAEDQKHE